jgi:exosortase A
MGTSVTLDSVEPWKQVGLILLMLLIGILMLYQESISSMVKIWLRSDTHAHGFLIAPISLYLVWQKRDSLIRIMPEPESRGLIVILVLSIIWLLAAQINIAELMHLFTVLVVIAAIASMLGRHATKEILFPLLYLLFAVPMGEELIEPLQDFTAVFVVAALKATGIPVLLEGRFFSIPSGDFEVAKACSGIRYLMVTVALGTVFAYLTYTSTKKRLIFIGVCIITPIIANGLRAYGIVMLAHLSDMKLAVGVDHFIYGWVFFGIIIFILFGVGAKWKDKKVHNASTYEISEGSNKSKNRYLLSALLILVSSSVGPLAYAYQNMAPDASNYKLIIMDHGSEWSISDINEINWSPDYRYAADVFFKQYSYNSDNVYLYVGMYTNENKNAELVSSENKLYKSGIWMRVSESDAKVTIKGNKQETINELILRSGNTKLLVWSWYNISGNKADGKYRAKLYQAWKKISGTETGSAIIAVATEFDDDPTSGRYKLERFINSVWPVINYKTINAAGK